MGIEIVLFMKKMVAFDAKAIGNGPSKLEKFAAIPPGHAGLSPPDLAGLGGMRLAARVTL